MKYPNASRKTGADDGACLMSKNDKKKKRKGKPPEQTFEEPRYLRYLIDHEIPVKVRLQDNEEVRGVIEFYDSSFIRLTRQDGPNLFIYKHDIKYLQEET
jgi:sRNA-binding regulator protein Hfq